MAGFVFVSYSRRDATYVDRLAGRLRGAGLDVWRDTEEIGYGDRWELVIRDRVDTCAAMIVVMSPAAEASPHVGNELQRARDRGVPILPILLSGEPFFALGTAHHFDARRGELPDDRFLDRLADRARPGRDGRTLVVGDPPAQAVAWQDRPGLLTELVRPAGSGGTAVVCALAGQRGVGKTQLAAAYARLRIQHGWPVVVWAVAETEAGVISTLDELAAAAGVRLPDADATQAARAALRWLRAHPGPCLLIYDNAVDADLIRAWTPSLGPVHTVVTTTRRELDSLGDLVDVTLFTPAEAVAYLRRRTGLDDPAGAGTLAEALGRLPLALAQAAAIVGPGRRYPSHRKYLAALADTATSELLPHTPGDPYPHGLAEAVLLSIDDLDRADPGGEARRLLEHLAVLAPTGAEPGLLQQLAGEDVDRLTALLNGRSLTVPGSGEADRTVVHRLVQRVVRERCRRLGTLDDRIRSAAGALGTVAKRTGQSWDDRTPLSECAEHAQVLLSHARPDETKLPVLRLIAAVLDLLNDANSHVTPLAAGPVMVAEFERILGPDHLETLEARNGLAEYYHSAGRLAESIDLHVVNVAELERAHGADHPSTMSASHNLATAYQAAGRFDEAIALHRRNLADSERNLGAEHRHTLVTLGNLAAAYEATGRYEEAVRLLSRSLEVGERTLGHDHFHLIATRNTLAAAYDATARVEEAIALLSRNLAASERVFGESHPTTLATRNNLAMTYQNAGRTREATELFRRNLVDTERVLGRAHPQTILAATNVGVILQNSGHLHESIELLTENLVVAERALGEQHPNTIAIRGGLALAYQEVARFDEAAAMFARNLADTARLYGDGHQLTVMARDSVGLGLFRTDRFAEAVELFTENLAIAERSLGDLHPITISARNNLALAYQAAGRAEEGTALLVRSLADAERLLGREHPRTVVLRNNVGFALQEADRVDEAAELITEARTLAELVFGVHSPQTAAARANLARAYHAMNRRDDARALLELAIADAEQGLGERHPTTKDMRAYLARISRETATEE